MRIGEVARLTSNICDNIRYRNRVVRVINYDDFLCAHHFSSKSISFYFLNCYFECIPGWMKGRITMRTRLVPIFFATLFFLGNGARPNEQTHDQARHVWPAAHPIPIRNWTFENVPIRSQTYASKASECVFWKKKQLQVYFSPLARAHGLPALFATGFHQWDCALDNGLSYSETLSIQDADIDIAMARSYGKHDRTLGVTEMEPDFGGCPLRHATIRIRGGFPNIAGTLSHELGHALGITGHSGAIDDLMWPDEQGCTHPGKRDLLTLRYLYSQF